MKTYRSLLVLLFAATVIGGCSTITVPYELRPEGDEVDIRTRDGKPLTGEFIAADDTAVYVLAHQISSVLRPPVSPNELLCIPYRNLKVITVNGYSDRSWILPVTLFQILPAVLMGIAADNSGEADGFATFGFALIPGVVTWILFETSTPPAPHAEWPFPEKELIALRKYARYPQGMPPGAVEALLERANRREMRCVK